MDGGTVRAWAVAAAEALDRARGPIDSLNVFPVPDGDTGTNLALTVSEAAQHVGRVDAPTGAAAVAAEFARGALLGARGNSGVIVSQYLDGFARGLVHAPDGGPGLARALDEAQRAARAAVARPVEGTILTAASAAAVAARTAADAEADERAVVAAAVAGARDALARTPQTLDVLRAAGVVDAGATGLVVLLGALGGVLGEPVTTATTTLRTVTPRASGAAAPGPAAGAADAWPDGAAHRRDDGEFEVMYVVRPPAPAGPDAGWPAETDDEVRALLSERLQALGTSVAVVGGSDGWHVHVHTDDPVAAVAAGDLGVRGPVGERSQVVVRRLAAPAADDAADQGLGIVVGTAAPGLVPELARAGALVLVQAGATLTAREVGRAVVDTGEPHVVVLPGSPPARASACEAAAADPRIEVLDADDEVRVVVALTADPGPAVPPAGRVAAMRAALAGVRTATVAVPDVAAVLEAARALLADGGDLLTVLVGAALDAVVHADELLDALTEDLAEGHPDVEIVVLPAHQAAPAALLAVEDA